MEHWWNDTAEKWRTWEMLYSFFQVIPSHLNFICQHFGTLCLFHRHRRRKLTPPMKMEQKGCSETSAYKIHIPKRKNTIIRAWWKFEIMNLGVFLSQCHIKHHISHTDWTGTEPSSTLFKGWHALSNDHIFLVSHTKCTRNNFQKMQWIKRSFRNKECK
jgi:hypothetical protein